MTRQCKVAEHTRLAPTGTFLLQESCGQIREVQCVRSCSLHANSLPRAYVSRSRSFLLVQESRIRQASRVSLEISKPQLRLSSLIPRATTLSLKTRTGQPLTQHCGVVRAATAIRRIIGSGLESEFSAAEPSLRPKLITVTGTSQPRA